MEFSFSEHMVLESEAVLIRPLKPEDFIGLSKIAYDYEIWRYNVSRCMNDEELKDYISSALRHKEDGNLYPLLVIDKKNNRAAGSTSFGNISNKDKRLEIGATWLGREFQGTGLNKVCKFLMLKYAFEILEYERVEFKTDVLNLQSRKALRKIGAAEEGILRSHTLMQDGRRRDTIYYSILKTEWPALKNTVFGELELR